MPFFAANIPAANRAASLPPVMSMAQSGNRSPMVNSCRRMRSALKRLVSTKISSGSQPRRRKKAARVSYRVRSWAISPGQR